MIAFAAAQSLLQQAALLLPTETVTLADALGRISSEPIHSRETIPPFANSAMDGFAVCAADLENAAESAISLPVRGLTAAGDAPATPAIARGTVWRIMTGAPLPAGHGNERFDSIVPIEQVELLDGGNHIRLNEPVTRGQHVRAAGEDFAKDDAVLAAGTRISPFHIAALATTGIGSLSVRRRPQVAHFATGNELIADANQPLQPGQIRNSNSPFLSTVLAQHGAVVHYGGQLRDEAALVAAQLRALIAGKPGERVGGQLIAGKSIDEQTVPDVILTTGAVSAGDFDFVPQVIRELGGEIIFHKVSIKPGKPILFAKLPNGSYFFGLPGNPVSTAIGFRFFVLPLLRALQGMPEPTPAWAALSGDLRKPKADWRHFLKAQLFVDGDGLLRVRAHSGQESHKIKPLLSSDVWLVLDEGRSEFHEGVRVPIASLFDETLPWHYR